MNPRKRMIKEIKSIYGLDAPGVFSAMSKVPRERFVPKGQKYLAYSDAALPIGFEQTISQPYTVAFMTNLVSSSLSLRLRGRILEIGTGSGYQAAVLARLFREVCSIERIPELARRAEEMFKELKIKNIKVKIGQGELGWEDYAPYDAVLITAGIAKVPRELFGQLKLGGVLVAPVGKWENRVMTKYRKGRLRISKKEFGIFSFVPFVEKD